MGHGPISVNGTVAIDSGINRPKKRLDDSAGSDSNVLVSDPKREQRSSEERHRAKTRDKGLRESWIVGTPRPSMAVNHTQRRDRNYCVDSKVEITRRHCYRSARLVTIARHKFSKADEAPRHEHSQIVNPYIGHSANYLGRTTAARGYLDLSFGWVARRCNKPKFP